VQPQMGKEIGANVGITKGGIIGLRESVLYPAVRARDFVFEEGGR
jgi:tetrahydromethanopterin S-methyltransferase subunit G